MEYIKHYGNRSADYLQFKPDYPKELYQYLASLNQQKDLAWDCGTGNGQAAVGIAEYFTKVIGTDITQGQLDVAIRKNNIEYHCCPAEKAAIPDTSTDLITVAQALHWFNLDKFYQEVIRVAKPDAVIAAWCYSLGKINPKIDEVIAKLYFEILGDQYWSPQRKFIDLQFETINFPFKKIKSPDFFIQKKIHFSHLIGYLNTWSAVKEYEKINKNNAVEFISSDLEKAWGNTSNDHIMYWPIHLLTAYILKE